MRESVSSSLDGPRGGANGPARGEAYGGVTIQLADDAMWARPGRSGPRKEQSSWNRVEERLIPILTCNRGGPGGSRSSRLRIVSGSLPTPCSGCCFGSSPSRMLRESVRRHESDPVRLGALLRVGGHCVHAVPLPRLRQNGMVASLSQPRLPRGHCSSREQMGTSISLARAEGPARRLVHPHDGGPGARHGGDRVSIVHSKRARP